MDRNVVSPGQFPQINNRYNILIHNSSAKKHVYYYRRTEACALWGRMDAVARYKMNGRTQRYAFQKPKKQKTPSAVIERQHCNINYLILRADT